MAERGFEKFFEVAQKSPEEEKFILDLCDMTRLKTYAEAEKKFFGDESKLSDDDRQRIYEILEENLSSTFFVTFLSPKNIFIDIKDPAQLVEAQGNMEEISNNATDSIIKKIDEYIARQNLTV